MPQHALDIPAPSFLASHTYNTYASKQNPTTKPSISTLKPSRLRSSNAGHLSASPNTPPSPMQQQKKKRKTRRASQQPLSQSFIKKLRNAEWIASLSEYKLDTMRLHEEQIEMGLRSAVAPSDMHQTTQQSNMPVRPHYVRNSSSVHTGRTVMDQYLDALYLKRLISHQDELRMAHEKSQSTVRAAGRLSARIGTSKHGKVMELHSINSPSVNRDEDPSSRIAVHSIVAPNCVLRRNSDIQRRATRSASSSRVAVKAGIQQQSGVGLPPEASHPPLELRSKSSNGYPGRRHHSISVIRNKENTPHGGQNAQVPLPVLKLGETALLDSHHSSNQRSTRRINHFTQITPEPFVDRPRTQHKSRSKQRSKTKMIRVTQHNSHFHRLSKTPKLGVIREVAQDAQSTGSGSVSTPTDLHQDPDTPPPFSKMSSESSMVTLDTTYSEGSRSSTASSYVAHPPTSENTAKSRRPSKRASTARSGMPSVEEGILSPRTHNREKRSKSKKKKRKPQEIDLNITFEDQLLSGWNLNLSGDGLNLSLRERSNTGLTRGSNAYLTDEE